MSATGLILMVDGADSQTFEEYCCGTGDMRFRAMISKLKQEGQWPFAFETMVCAELVRRGCFMINTLLLAGIDGTNANDLTRGMIEGRQEAQILFDIIRRYVPGFTMSRLVQTSPVLGVRDTRRIRGLYEVSVQDIREGKHYRDTIALSGYQWDMADPKRPSHQRMNSTEISLPYTEIPYRCLVPQGIDNLVVAGRCVSCDWDALGVLRIMPACFAMGQAAGTAAAKAAQKDVALAALDTDQLRAVLQRQGAILSTSD